MTTTATEFVKPERIYEPRQFELDDAPEDVKAYSLLYCLTTGELITNDEMMDAITMGLNLLPRVAPTAADRVRITEVLADEVRHCYMNDHMARALGGDPSLISFFSNGEGSELWDSVTAAASPELAAILGDRWTLHGQELVNDGQASGGESLASVGKEIFGSFFGGVGPTKALSPTRLWAIFAGFNMCIDRVAGMMIKDTVNSSFAPIARMNVGIANDEAGHAQMGYHHLRDLCATKEGREDAQAGVDLTWRLALSMFDMFPPEDMTEFVRLGLTEHTHAELRETFVDVTGPLLEGIGLCVPSAA